MTSSAEPHWASFASSYFICVLTADCERRVLRRHPEAPMLGDEHKSLQQPQIQITERWNVAFHS